MASLPGNCALSTWRRQMYRALLDPQFGPAYRTPTMHHCQLSSKDCVLQIVAKGHARRKTDGANYPSLERLNFLYTNHGDVDAYLQADPAEVLSYILDDLATALSFNLVDKTADGLAMLVSQLTQAAISQVPGEHPCLEAGTATCAAETLAC